MDQDARRLLRPLLPACPTRHVRPGSSSSSSARDETRVTLAPKRKNVFSACSLCRKRKVRCDGRVPRCEECTRRDAHCVYPADGPDGPEAVKKKLTDVEERLEAHEELYRILQTKPEEESLSIFRRIRNGHDVRSILRQLKDGDLLLQVGLSPETRQRYSFPLRAEMPSFLLGSSNPYLQSTIYRRLMEVGEAPPATSTTPVPGSLNQQRSDLEAQYYVPYHAAKLVEPRLDVAKPSQWTSVPLSDELLRDLLRSYFLHEYPMFPCFHKDLFLQDMTAGRNRFCSSLLHSYTKASNRKEFWNPQSLLYQFSAEARRLWELAIQTDTVPTVQAGLLMTITCNMNGVDKIGLRYLVQVIAMGDRISLFDATPPTMDKSTRIVRAMTAWCVFNFQSMFCFHFFRPPLIKLAPQHALPDPQNKSSWYPEIWMMYPSSNNPIPTNLGDHFKAVSGFRTIVNEIGAVAFPKVDSRNMLSPEEAWAFYSRLKTWYQNPPKSLSVAYAVQPFQLLVHMHYFNIVIMLLEPFTSAQTQATEGDSRASIPEGGAQEAVSGAKVQFETILRLYYLRHGFEAYDPLILQFQIMLGFMTLGTLSNIGATPPDIVEGLRSTLALVINGMRDNSRNTYLAETTFHLLRNAIKQKEPRLLREIADASQEHDETPARIQSHVQSLFPINIVSIAADPEDRRVGNLVAAYKELGLGDTSESEGQQD